KDHCGVGSSVSVHVSAQVGVEPGALPFTPPCRTAVRVNGSNAMAARRRGPGTRPPGARSVQEKLARFHAIGWAWTVPPSTPPHTIMRFRASSMKPEDPLRAAIPARDQSEYGAPKRNVNCQTSLCQPPATPPNRYSREL